MELIIKNLSLPEAIEFNYDELKAYLTERVSDYKSIAYTEDNIKTAKVDRAALNSLEKALNGERIRLEKEWLAPFQDFKAKVTELCGIVREASSCIDIQVKEYEKMQKDKKQKEIMAIWNEILYTWVPVSACWNEKWLNASYSMNQIRKDLEDIKARIDADMGMLSRLPEYSFEAAETYKKTLKTEDALWTADNLRQMAEAKKQAEQAEFQTDPVQSEDILSVAEDCMPAPEKSDLEPYREWIGFRAYLSFDEAVSLNQFFKTRKIAFEKL